MRRRPLAARCLPGGLLFAALLLGGCATPQTDRLLRAAPAFPHPVDAAAVPFFPQRRYQCGPAALATVLAWAGASVRPADLTPLVYLPARRGSLQPELIAAARRYRLVPYVLRPRLQSVFDEVAAGHPVLVLQNVALSWYPMWHYAVVVGFDLRRGTVTLRSGTDARHVLPLPVFERTWRRAQDWSMVVLPRGQLPATAEEDRYVESVAALEQLKHYRAAAAAYRAALGRWPQSLGARMGLGNSLYALGDLGGAARAFARATRDHPNAAPAFNNLAQTLADEHHLTQARAAAEHAIALGGLWIDAYRATLAQIEARAAARGAAHPGATPH